MHVSTSFFPSEVEITKPKEYWTPRCYLPIQMRSRFHLQRFSSIRHFRPEWTSQYKSDISNLQTYGRPGRTNWSEAPELVGFKRFLGYEDYWWVLVPRFCVVYRKGVPFCLYAAIVVSWLITPVRDPCVGYDHNWSAASSYPVQLMQDAGSAFDGVSFHCYAVSTIC